MTAVATLPIRWIKELSLSHDQPATSNTTCTHFADPSQCKERNTHRNTATPDAVHILAALASPWVSEEIISSPTAVDVSAFAITI